MVRRKGKFRNVMISAVVLAAAFVLSVPVFSNDQRGKWKEHAYTPGTNISSNTMIKTTNSSVYSEYTKGSSQFVGVRVFAAESGSSNFSDVTYRGPYYVYAGAGNGIEVMNLAYERKGGQCRAYTLYTTISDGDHEGIWIPH